MSKALPISQHALANPVISDLTKHRWRGPILTSDEERELVRRSQAGDGNAKRRLLEAFDRLLKKEASQYYGPPFEERLGQALGRVDKLNPDLDAGKQHEGGEALDQLVVAGGDTA